MMNAYIKAISYDLPKKIVTNADIVKEFPEWSIEKINSKIGIRERHVVSEGETASDIGISAAKKLFSEYNIDKSDIDFLIFCTESPDYHLPPSACIIQSDLELSKTIGAIDINLGCSGWVYCLLMAKSLIISGLKKNVLIITAETYSIYMHPKDKGNRTIFGDGAAATLVSSNGMAKIGEIIVGTDGTGADNLIVKVGGARLPQAINDIEYDDFGNPKSSDFLYMNGPEILNYTLDVFPKLVHDVLKANSLSLENIDLHVYHQPNRYMAKLERRKLKIDTERYYEFYENCGNTVSSTIPIALYEAVKDGTLKKEFKVLSIAQGLGYSWGGVVLFF